MLFRLCANTDPQRDSIVTIGPADVLAHATSESAMGTKLGIDATRKLTGEGFERPWSPLIKMSDEVRRKPDAPFKTNLKRATRMTSRIHSRLCIQLPFRYCPTHAVR